MITIINNPRLSGRNTRIREAINIAIEGGKNDKYPLYLYSAVDSKLYRKDKNGKWVETSMDKLKVKKSPLFNL